MESLIEMHTKCIIKFLYNTIVGTQKFEPGHKHFVSKYVLTTEPIVNLLDGIWQIILNHKMKYQNLGFLRENEHMTKYGNSQQPHIIRVFSSLGA